MKNIFNKEQTTNLTELTDKTIQENRDSADAKTQKQVDLASGTGAAMSKHAKSPPPQQERVVHLHNLRIKGSPYIDVYNTHIAILMSVNTQSNFQLVDFFIADYPPIGVNQVLYVRYTEDIMICYYAHGDTD